jgi:hypothetical protein
MVGQPCQPTPAASSNPRKASSSVSSLKSLPPTNDYVPGSGSQKRKASLPSASLANPRDKRARKRAIGSGTPGANVTSTNILMVGSLGSRNVMIDIEGLFGFLLLQTAERVYLGSAGFVLPAIIRLTMSTSPRFGSQYYQLFPFARLLGSKLRLHA